MADIHIFFLADGTPQFIPKDGFTVGADSVAVTFSTTHDCLLSFQDQHPNLGSSFIATSADLDVQNPGYPVALVLPQAVGQVCHMTVKQDNGLTNAPGAAYPIRIVAHVLAPIHGADVTLTEVDGTITWTPPSPLHVKSNASAVTFTVSKNCHFSIQNTNPGKPVFIASQVAMKGDAKLIYPIGLVLPLGNNNCKISARIANEPEENDPPPFDIIIGDGADHPRHHHHKAK